MLYVVIAGLILFAIIYTAAFVQGMEQMYRRLEKLHDE